MVTFKGPSWLHYDCGYKADPTQKDTGEAYCQEKAFSGDIQRISGKLWNGISLVFYLSQPTLQQLLTGKL